MAEPHTSPTSHYDAAENILELLRDPNRMPLKQGATVIEGQFEVATITALGGILHAVLAVCEEVHKLRVDRTWYAPRVESLTLDPNAPWNPPSRREDFE